MRPSLATNDLISLFHLHFLALINTSRAPLQTHIHCPDPTSRDCLVSVCFSIFRLVCFRVFIILFCSFIFISVFSSTRFWFEWAFRFPTVETSGWLSRCPPPAPLNLSSGRALIGWIDATFGRGESVDVEGGIFRSSFVAISAIVRL